MEDEAGSKQRTAILMMYFSSFSLCYSRRAASIPSTHSTALPPASINSLTAGPPTSTALRHQPCLRASTSLPYSPQPPVIPAGLAGKYAGALFTAASKSSDKTLTQVEKDLKALSQIITTTPEVATFLANPTLPANEKASGMKKLLEKIGATSSDYTKNFLNVLAENGRLYETEKVIEAFEQIMSSYRGELEITITCGSRSYVLGFAIRVSC